MELKLGLDPFFMKVFRYFPIILGVGALVACGGSKPAPVVDPVATPVNAPAVNEPVVPDLVPVPEPKPAEEQKVFLDNAVDRYSYALGVDFGRAVSNINVPVKLEVLIGAMRDVIDSTREILSPKWRFRICSTRCRSRRRSMKLLLPVRRLAIRRRSLRKTSRTRECGSQRRVCNI